MRPTKGLVDEALGRLNVGEALVLATVVETWGSSPRPVGSEMFVTQAGEMQGSVSGGCIEASVVGEASGVFDTGTPRVLEFGVSNDRAWEVGLSCGGRIKVYLERLDPKDSSLLGQLHDIESLRARRRPVAWVRDLDSGARSILHDDPTGPCSEGGGPATAALREGRSQVVDTADGRQLFVRAFEPAIRLVVIGAVHVAQDLAVLAEPIGFETVIVDPRRAWASNERFGNASLCHDWPDEALGRLKPDRRTAVAALSHDPKLDDPGLAAALDSSAFYIGALGSRRTHEKRLQRLSESGWAAEDLARIHGPIGLDIRARSPGEIALAILAQIVQEKNRRDWES